MSVIEDIAPVAAMTSSPVAAASGAAGTAESWQTKIGQLLFLMLVFRLPWFEIPCELGKCNSPLDIVVIELYAYNRAPHTLLRTILWPGAFLQVFADALNGEEGEGFPNWGSLLEPYANVPIKEPFSTNVPWSWQAAKDERLDLKLGSFLSVLGGIFSLAGPTVLSTMGTSLVAIYCYRLSWATGQGVFQPFFALAIFASLAWVRWDSILAWLDTMLYASQGKSKPAGAEAMAADPQGLAGQQQEASAEGVAATSGVTLETKGRLNRKTSSRRRR